MQFQSRGCFTGEVADCVIFCVLHVFSMTYFRFLSHFLTYNAVIVIWHLENHVPEVQELCPLSFSCFSVPAHGKLAKEQNNNVCYRELRLRWADTPWTASERTWEGSMWEHRNKELCMRSIHFLDRNDDVYLLMGSKFCNCRAPNKAAMFECPLLKSSSPVWPDVRGFFVMGIYKPRRKNLRPTLTFGTCIWMSVPRNYIESLRGGSSFSFKSLSFRF
jgi:hypothetical protein